MVDYVKRVNKKAADQLVALALEKNKLSYSAGSTFSDGSVSNMEVLRAGKPDKVAAA